MSRATRSIRRAGPAPFFRRAAMSGAIQSGTPPPGLTLRVTGRLVRGHRVASGLNGDPRFPGGSIALQTPHFRARGLDLGAYHPGTLNVSLEPSRITILRPRHSFRDLRWHPTEPAEDFSFLDAAVRAPDGEWIAGLVYYPHPETKPAHRQPPHLVEILARTWIPGLAYGAGIALALDPSQIAVRPPEAGAGEGEGKLPGDHSQP